MKYDLDYHPQIRGSVCNMPRFTSTKSPPNKYLETYYVPVLPAAEEDLQEEDMGTAPPEWTCGGTSAKLRNPTRQHPLRKVQETAG